MVRRRSGTLEQWQELGDLTKELEAKINELSDKAGAIMPIKSAIYPLNKARSHVSQFKSQAEDLMFKQQPSAKSLEHGGLHVFYGGS